MADLPGGPGPVEPVRLGYFLGGLGAYVPLIVKDLGYPP